jgi:hypothetical protein
MRYYNITIAGAPSDVFPPRYDGGAQWGTILNGQHDPNAQQIEFQIQEYNSTQPTENCVLTIHGVTWEQIKASNSLVGKVITVYGGMSPGLPLATFQSQRDKLLLQGTIYRCWGNWIGTEMSIGMDFVATGAKQASSTATSSPTAIGAPSPTVPSITQYDRTGPRSIDRMFRNRVQGVQGLPNSSAITDLGGNIVKLVSNFDIGPATSVVGGMTSSFFGGGNIAPLSQPLNLIHNMMPGMDLSSAIQDTLSKAFPQANINVLISQGIKMGYQDAGMYQSLEQYSDYIQKLSQSVLGSKNYQGVQLTSYNNTLTALDFTKPVSNGDINYLDLIGQPTWLDIATISVKVVLRGGLHVGSYVTLPQTLVNFAGADAAIPMGAPDQRTHISLPGVYWVDKILHIGDFRNPDGASWSTNYMLKTLSSTSFTSAFDVVHDPLQGLTPLQRQSTGNGGTAP